MNEYDMFSWTESRVSSLIAFAKFCNNREGNIDMYNKYALFIMLYEFVEVRPKDAMLVAIYVDKDDLHDTCNVLGFIRDSRRLLSIPDDILYQADLCNMVLDLLTTMNKL